jgi:hypothetical protein
MVGDEGPERGSCRTIRRERREGPMTGRNGRGGVGGAHAFLVLDLPFHNLFVREGVPLSVIAFRRDAKPPTVSSRVQLAARIVITNAAIFLGASVIALGLVSSHA